MKTINQYRKSMCQTLQNIKDLYPDLEAYQQIFLAIQETEKLVAQTADETKRASIGEFAKVYEPIFVNRDGTPTQAGKNRVEKLLSQIRKSGRYPLIRPYKKPLVELLADGTEAIRYYVALLMGKSFVEIVNARALRRMKGEKNQMIANNNLLNIKKVRREAERYELELKAKQNDANNRKNKKRKP